MNFRIVEVLMKKPEIDHGVDIMGGCTPGAGANFRRPRRRRHTRQLPGSSSEVYPWHCHPPPGPAARRRGPNLVPRGLCLLKVLGPDPRAKGDQVGVLYDERP